MSLLEKMDIIKSIKSWKPRNGFQRKTKSLQHGHQQQNLETLRRMNDTENERFQNEETILHHKSYGHKNDTHHEYWSNASMSSNTSASNYPMREDTSACSNSSSLTHNSTRVATTLPSGNHSLGMFQDENNTGKFNHSNYKNVESFLI